MNIAVFPNFEKKNAYPVTLEVCNILRNMGVKITADETHSDKFRGLPFVDTVSADNAADMCDIMIAIGGDGTILQCSSYAAARDKPLLGINTGRLGFMASLESDELDLLSRLITGEFEIEKRMMIKAEIYRCGICEHSVTALNDIIISRPYSRIADFEILTEGRTVSKTRADGVVFSTPTGSTAYALSAGGPILEPYLECIEFSPICPHSLLSRTMLLSASHEIEVRYSGGQELYFTADGKPGRILGNEDTVIISKSEKSLRLIDIKGFSFYDAVNNKLMQPLK